jgi:hypothetical protein
LEADFEKNLARLYSKGGHKSGVEGCHQMIEDNTNNPDAVGIFLNSLSNKNLLALARNQSNTSF